MGPVEHVLPVAPEAGAVTVTVMVDVGAPPGMATARMESESTK